MQELFVVLFDEVEILSAIDGVEFGCVDYDFFIC